MGKSDSVEMISLELTTCKECGNSKLIKDYERAEIICMNCGLVLRERLMDDGPEWRAFDMEQMDKRARVGAPSTYTIHDKGLSTMIDWRNKDIFGKNLTPRKRAQIYRLRKWQRRIRISDAKERNLAVALSELDRMASHLSLPRNVREVAAMIYRKAVENRIIRGRSIEGVCAAALYAACRRCRIPRTLEEIAEIAKVNKKEIGRSYRYLARKLNISIPPTDPVDYISRFIAELNLSGIVQKKSVEILRNAVTSGLTSGRGPMGLAAASIYIASLLLNERRTQREIAETAKVTEVTVRNRYKELIDKLKINIII
ncbi:MAG TPA: transcription initiation factor IIB [Candidatus Deferrimicrobium sp.]|nr:transcription initiation factor IIB [Candidatus Deferrimicrobium sp.]